MPVCILLAESPTEGVGRYPTYLRSVGIIAYASYSVDDVDLVAVDGANYTYAYNDANELTAMNLDGVETHFTYDDWGRGEF